MKIRSVGAELFHADGRTDRHDEANSRFPQFCERTRKISQHFMQRFNSYFTWNIVCSNLNVCHPRCACILPITNDIVHLYFTFLKLTA